MPWSRRSLQSGNTGSERRGSRSREVRVMTGALWGDEAGTGQPRRGGGVRLPLQPVPLGAPESPALGNWGPWAPFPVRGLELLVKAFGSLGLWPGFLGSSVGPRAEAGSQAVPGNACVAQRAWQRGWSVRLGNLAPLGPLPPGKTRGPVPPPLCSVAFTCGVQRCWLRRQFLSKGERSV